MADWAAVHLAERMGDLSGTERAGIAVTIFAGFMAGGRFLGDWLKRRLGAVKLARFRSNAALRGKANSHARKRVRRSTSR